MLSLNKALAIGLVSAFSLAGTSPSSAAPISNGAALKQAVPNGVTDVRWRGGGGFGVGLGVGLLGGAMIGGGYGPYYGGYYPGPYYGPGPYSTGALLGASPAPLAAPALVTALV